MGSGRQDSEKAGSGKTDSEKNGPGKSDSESRGFVEQARTYFDESLVELKKVTTPTRAEATQATLVTIVLIMVMAMSLFVLDVLFMQLRGALFGH